MEQTGALRIGELSRRAGVSDHVLRAWETRYGLLRPTRSVGGYRLYSAADEQRVRRMKQLLADGLSAAEAARAVVAAESPIPSAHVVDDSVAQEAEALRDALDAFDEPTAQAVLDRLLTTLSLVAVLREVIVPYLHELGERWREGSVTVAQEHFASNLLRGRLAGLALGWGAGRGPRAVLACPPEELHDLPLMIFGIALNRLGWRITYLGSNTPLSELQDAVAAGRPDLIVLAAVASHRFEDIAAGLTELCGRYPVALAGAGSDAAFAERVGARLLADDPVSEAQAVAHAS